METGSVAAGPDERAAIIAMLWEARAQSRRGRKPTLRLETIAEIGIALADAEGLAAATMQRVGEALGVTKMALYRYAPGKEALLALMLDTGIGPPPSLATIPGGWRPRLDHWSRRLFDRFVRHPWSAEAAIGARIIGPNEVGWLEQACATLAGSGLRGDEILDLAATLSGHVGAIARQVAANPSGSAEEQILGSLAGLVRGREGQFPALAGALRAADAEATRDQALDFGLNRIFDGVELLIAGRAAVG